mmetsp:Transcript_8609/g.13504  ORF Transcript_8609/g.13504 Transcript_8609/m.13504 type:complete len:218 (-) Transcript_8609:974-1627(-)
MLPIAWLGTVGGEKAWYSSCTSRIGATGRLGKKGQDWGMRGSRMLLWLNLTPSRVWRTKIQTGIMCLCTYHGRARKGQVRLSLRIHEFERTSRLCARGRCTPCRSRTTDMYSRYFSMISLILSYRQRLRSKEIIGWDSPHPLERTRVSLLSIKCATGTLRRMRMKRSAIPDLQVPAACWTPVLLSLSVLHRTRVRNVCATFVIAVGVRAKRGVSLGP